MAIQVVVVVAAASFWTQVSAIVVATAINANLMIRVTATAIKVDVQIVSVLAWSAGSAAPAKPALHLVAFIGTERRAFAVYTIASETAVLRIAVSAAAV